METGRQCVDMLIPRGSVALTVLVTAHINNLYNTTFWLLVQKEGLSTSEAHARLKVSSLQFHDLKGRPRTQGTTSSQKHEILHGTFGVNYNSTDSRFRKGSILRRRSETHDICSISLIRLVG